MTADELEALHSVMHRLESRWLPSPPSDTDVFFAYDPLPIASFLPPIRVAIGHAQGDRFMDIGCGIGTKLALMFHLGFRVHGIDKHQPYLDAAAELIPEATLEHADVRDVARFDADIIYMYRPGVAEEMASTIERHVVERSPSGTVMVLPNRHLTLGLRQVAPEVWVK